LELGPYPGFGSVESGGHAASPPRRSTGPGDSAGALSPRPSRGIEYFDLVNSPGVFNLVVLATVLRRLLRCCHRARRLHALKWSFHASNTVFASGSPETSLPSRRPAARGRRRRPPKPARLDADAQKAGAQPALPPAPAGRPRRDQGKIGASGSLSSATAS
jgi:hypothetical protein